MVPWSSQFKNYISSIPVLRKFSAVPQSKSAYSLGLTAYSPETKVDEYFLNTSTNANPVNDSVKMANDLTRVDSATSPTNKKSVFEGTGPLSNVNRNGSVSNFPKEPFTSNENKNININEDESTVERRPSIRYSNLHPSLQPKSNVHPILQPKRTSSRRSCRRLKRIRNLNNAKSVPVSRFPFGCSVHVIDNSKNKIQRSSNVATVPSPKQNDLPVARSGRNQIQPGPGMHVSQNISRSLSEKLLSVRHNPVIAASRHSSDLEHSFIKGRII